MIHAAVMGPDLRSNADVVRRATLSTLRRAEELRLHSVAFPAFGTGVGRMEPKDCADAMVGALRAHFAEVAESSLRRIHLVLFQEDTYQAFGALLGSGRLAGPADTSRFQTFVLVRPLLLAARR